MNNVNIEFIEKFLKEKGLTAEEFCQANKISPQIWKKVMAGKTNFRMQTVLKLVEAFNTNCRTLFNV